MAENERWEEAMLESLGRSVAYPPAPDLRAAVLARLGDPARPQPSRWRLALAGIALLVLASAAVVAVSRDAREAIAEFLGLAVEGERIEVLPTPAPGTTPTPFSTPIRLDELARKTTLADAAASAGFAPVLPPDLGEPRAVYYLAASRTIVADYGTVQVWEFELADEIFVGKGVTGGGSVVSAVTVNGKPGYWITGGSRVFEFIGGDGTPIAGTQRTVTENALVWASGGLYRRIEGPASLEEALRIAGTMR